MWPPPVSPSSPSAGLDENGQLEWPAGHPCESWVRKIPDIPLARLAGSGGRETGIAILHPERLVSFGVYPALRKRCRELNRRSCSCGIYSPDIRQAAGCFGAQNAGCSGTLQRRKSQDPWLTNLNLRWERGLSFIKHLDHHMWWSGPRCSILFFRIQAGIGGVQRKGRAWAGTVRDGFARRRVLVSLEGGYNWKRPRGGGRNQEELGTIRC